MSELQLENEFVESLQAEDELGLVLLAHIHIEAQLLKLISLLANEKALEKMKLDYAKRVHLAVALGLKEDHSKGLLALGNLRNAFAHQLGLSLTDSRVNNLYNALSSVDKAAVQESYKRAETLMKQHHEKKFHELPPRDRFVLIAVALQSMLTVAVHEVRKSTLA